MRKAEKVLRIQQVLDRFYPDVPIPLTHRNAYAVLVAVMLSAQTTDKKVNQITPALFALANTPQQMAELPESAIKQVIQEIGLSNVKAKNLKQLSRLLVERHSGEVPENFADLEALPGVGHKTASVVMSQGFGYPAFPVDTHIHRLAQRWGLTKGKNVEQTEKDLKRLFPKRSWNKLHLQIIYYGREYCKARECYGVTCKICTSCYPNRKKPIKTKKA